MRFERKIGNTFFTLLSALAALNLRSTPASPLDLVAPTHNLQTGESYRIDILLFACIAHPSSCTKRNSFGVMGRWTQRLQSPPLSLKGNAAKDTTLRWLWWIVKLTLLLSLLKLFLRAAVTGAGANCLTTLAL